MGILLFAVQIIFFIATITYNEVLILMYLWYVIAFSFIDVLIACFVAIVLITNNTVLLGISIISSDLLLWIFVYSFIIPAVNGFRTNIHTIRILIK